MKLDYDVLLKRADKEYMMNNPGGTGIYSRQVKAILKVLIDEINAQSSQCSCAKKPVGPPNRLMREGF